MDVDALRDRNEEKAERQAEAGPASSASKGAADETLEHFRVALA
jgi:hypothetical protein